MNPNIPQDTKYSSKASQPKPDTEEVIWQGADAELVDDLCACAVAFIHKQATFAVLKAAVRKYESDMRRLQNGY